MEEKVHSFVESDNVSYDLAESLPAFLLRLETLPMTKIKGGRIINLADFSKQSNVGQWIIFVGGFSQLYFENQEQIVQQNDIKLWSMTRKEAPAKF